jgi:hypothetical protein
MEMRIRGWSIFEEMGIAGVLTDDALKCKDAVDVVNTEIRREKEGSVCLEPELGSQNALS